MNKYLLALFLLVLGLIVLFGCGLWLEEREIAEKTQPVVAVPVTDIRLLTYNVLADKVHDKRPEALLGLIENCDADIIALQEVSPWFIAELGKHEWFKSYYTSRVGGEVASYRGLILLSKFLIKDTRHELLPGRQMRAALFVDLDIGGKVVTVATCHLESPLGSGAIRAKQLTIFSQRLAGCDNAILMGDFNFGDGEEPDSSALPKRFDDVWRQLYPKNSGYTWNIEKSPMAKRGSFIGEKSRRLDRILVKCSGISFNCAQIIGSKPISDDRPDVFPSDHFGLFCEIRLALDSK